MDLEQLNFLPEWDENRFSKRMNRHGEAWKNAPGIMAARDLYIQWRELFGLVIAFSENLADDNEATHQSSTKSLIYQNALIVAPKIMGVDGASKMSKTLNNYIGLLEDRDSRWEKRRTAVTDGSRVRRKDPGKPEVCNVYTIHRAFSPNESLLEIDKGCITASIGCIDCKKTLFSNMMAELDPIREKADSLNNDIDYVVDVLKTGADTCRAIAVETMDEVRKTIGLLL